MRIAYRFKTVLALILALAMLLALIPASTVLALESEATATPTVAPEATPTKAPETTPTKAPEAPATPTAAPDATATPTVEPEATVTPTVAPDATATPTATPVVTPKPEGKKATPTPEPDAESDEVSTELETPEPTASAEPEQTDDAAQTVIATVSLKGSITWNGFASAADRPSVRITLRQNRAVMAGKEPIVTKGDGYAFTGLPKSDGSADYAYGIKVSAISGCSVSISGNNVTVTLKPQPAEEPGEPTSEPAAAPLSNAPAGPELQDVIAAINALPDTIDPADAAAANQLMAVMDAMSALDDAAYEQLPAELVTKVNLLMAALSAGSGASVMAVQTDTVTATVKWAADVPTTVDKDTAAITVNLVYQDAEENNHDEDAVINKASGWKASYTGVNALKPHTLTVVSGIPAGCMASLSSATAKSITITIQKALTTMPNAWVKVVWNNVAAPTAGVAIALVADGAETSHTFVSPTWTYDFGQMVEGKAYSVNPGAVTGCVSSVNLTKTADKYTYTVTYSAKPETFTYKGNLVFDFGPAAENPQTRPNIVVTLKRVFPVPAVIGTAQCPEGDDEFEFVDVPKTIDGQLCIYSVSGSNIANYTQKADTKRAGGDSKIYYYYDKQPNRFNLGVQVSWRDDNNKRGRRPIETTVYLYANGSDTGKQLQVKYADGWSTVFDALEYKDAKGKVIKYTVRAGHVDYYGAETVSAKGSLAKVLYIYGAPEKKSSTGGSTAKIAPDVSDPSVALATTLTESQKLQYEAEATRAQEAALELAVVARAGSVNDVDFKALQKINKDIAGWLTADGTTIDYPVLKGSNNSYYLNRLYNKEQNRTGSLFIDSNCNRYFSDRNTVIYGRNMGSGSMFASLIEYKDQSYYDAHPTMRLSTPKGDYEIELFAAMTVGEDYATVSKRKFSGNSDFASYITSCVNQSDIKTNVNVSSTDKIVTLVTSPNDRVSARYLVMGRLVQVG